MKMQYPKFFIGPMSKNVVDSIIEFTAETGNKVGFISRGGVFNLDYEKQPSIVLYKMFGIYDYF